MKSQHGFSKKREKKEKSVEKLETVKQEVKQVIAEDPSKIQELETLIANLEEAAAAYKMNEVFLNKNFADMQAENNDLRNQLDKLKEENSNLRASAEDTESEAYAAALNIKELTTRNAELTEEVERLRENVRVAETDCSLLSGRNKELASKLRAVERETLAARNYLKEVL